MEPNHQHPHSSQAQPTTSIRSPSINISDAINTATRQRHAVLNRLIIERLPLALPPRDSDPAKFGQGIAAFARIYFNFEQVWQEIAESAGSIDAPNVSPETRRLQWLATLRPPGLTRTERLGLDIRYIKDCTGTEIDKCSAAQERIFRRMRRSLRKRPHTLVAYAWVMYMALFSGGRWIRQLLIRAGPEFWRCAEANNATAVSSHEKQLASPHETRGFSFLSFDDGNDGAGIKAEFKRRLTEAEAILSDRERKDIIRAAQKLFDDCITLVGILDREVVRQDSIETRSWRTLSEVAVSVIGVAGMVFLFWVGMEFWDI